MIKEQTASDEYFWVAAYGFEYSFWGRVQQLVQAFSRMDGLLTALAFLALLAGALGRGWILGDSASFGWLVCR